VDLIKPSPPSRRNLERFIGFMILVLVLLAVPYAHGVLQYCGLLLVGLLLVVLSQVVVVARTNTNSDRT
jgi:hypothetical protein